MSRFCGSWAALKCMHETWRSTAVVDGALDRVKIVIPGDGRIQNAAGRANIRLVDGILDMEARLHDFKRDAMLAFVHEQAQQVIISGGRNPKIGIITVGKVISTCAGVRRIASRGGSATISHQALQGPCPWPISRRE